MTSGGSRAASPILNVADMDLEDATLLAASYATKDAEVKRLQKEMAQQKEALQQFMGLNNFDGLVDEETGLGVRYGKPRTSTTWDTLSMPASLIEQLHALNLLDVRTTAIEKQKGTSQAVDEAQRYAIHGETAAPFQVVKGNDR